jgi:putative ABC transport system ATP-binding protein
MEARMVQVRDLVMRLRSAAGIVTILDGVTLDVPAGQFVAVIGPSGSGKSTLLGLLAGLDRPTTGSIRIDGVELSTLDEDAIARLRLAKIGYVFQSFHLIPTLTAIENVAIPLELAGAAEPARRAGALLEEVGLKARVGHYPAELSGGEQQRVALARALAPAPKHLFLDEPFASIDLPLKSRLLAEIARLADQQHLTIVLVTHDPLEALTLCNDAIVLERGRVAERGQLENLLAAPAQRSETLCAFANQLRALKPIRWAAAQRSDETA